MKKYKSKTKYNKNKRNQTEKKEKLLCDSL